MSSTQPSSATGHARPGAFDIVNAYKKLLADDAELTMPVAAIEALILGLAQMPTNTVAEMLDLVSRLTTDLREGIPNWISLSAGTDLFQQYLVSNLQKPSARGEFEEIRAHLVQNGRLFVERAKAARHTIASFGKHFIHDGNVVLTNGGSRVVGSLLKSAAESTDASRSGSIRFKVVYVVSEADDSECQGNIAALRALDIPVSVIPPTAIAYCMHMVTACFVGAEGVVENGGIVSRLGTYQMGMLAHATGKPFYVVSETHKFVRLHPLGQDDLGIQQSIIDFRTSRGSESTEVVADESIADMDATPDSGLRCQRKDAVDYTPPNLISGIITESGVLLPSAVSEELIKIWF